MNFLKPSSTAPFSLLKSPCILSVLPSRDAISVVFCATSVCKPSIAALLALIALVFASTPFCKSASAASARVCSAAIAPAFASILPSTSANLSITCCFASVNLSSRFSLYASISPLVYKLLADTSPLITKSSVSIVVITLPAEVSSTSPRNTESTAAAANTSALPLLSTSFFKSSTTFFNACAAPPFKSKSRALITVPVDWLLAIVNPLYLVTSNHAASIAIVPPSPVSVPILER